MVSKNMLFCMEPSFYMFREVVFWFDGFFIVCLTSFDACIHVDHIIIISLSFWKRLSNGNYFWQIKILFKFNWYCDIIKVQIIILGPPRQLIISSYHSIKLNHMHFQKKTLNVSKFHNCLPWNQSNNFPISVSLSG